MVQRHPHTDATYKVVKLAKTSFGVEVAVPETCPATVSNFESKQAAEAWIVRHKEIVATSTSISRGPRSRMMARHAAPGQAPAAAQAPIPPAAESQQA